MTHILVRWKPAYDSHAASRAAAGLTEERLLRNADNGHEVIILFAVSDPRKARAFAASSDLREAMLKAGVTDKPDIFFLE